MDRQLGYHENKIRSMWKLLTSRSFILTTPGHISQRGRRIDMMMMWSLLMREGAIHQKDTAKALKNFMAAEDVDEIMAKLSGDN